MPAAFRFSTGSGATLVEIYPGDINWNMSTGQGDRITEQMTIVVANAVGARLMINSLERMFDKARSRYAEIGGDEGLERVYIEYKPVDSDDYWRSEVFGGVCDPGLEPWNGYENTDIINDCHVRFGVAFERENAWEGPEANLEMVSHLANGSTLTITNDVYSYVDIFDDAIAASDLPVRVKLKMKNTVNSLTQMSDMYVGLTRGGSLNLDGFFEAELATALTTSSVNTGAGSGYSNGQTRSFTWSGTAETNLCKWAVATGINNLMRGGSATPIVRIAGFIPSGLQMRAVVSHMITPVARTPWVDVTQEIQQLGRIRLPARYVGVAAVTDVELSLQVKIGSSGSHTFEIDYVTLLGRDQMKLFRRVGTATEYGGSLVDDPFDGIVYQQLPAGGRIASYAPSTSEPLMIRPNEAASIRFLHVTATGAATANRTLEVTATYRPRRRSI